MTHFKLIRLMLAAIFLGAAVVGAVAPAQAKDTAGPRILAIGDSLMAWHRGAGLSIADNVSKHLSVPVTNRSISGARMIYNLPITGAMGMKIANQVRKDKYDWVIMTGGGNDFMLGCGCGACKRRMSRLISPDGLKGEVPKLISNIRQSGARVVYVGYLRSPGMGSPIEACKDEGDEFESRLARLAKIDEGLHFLSLEDLVPSGDRSYHGADMIHPSRKASKIIGAQVASLIKKASGNR